MAFEVTGQGLPNKVTLPLPTDRNPWAHGSLPGSNSFLLDVDDLDEFGETTAEVPVCPQAHVSPSIDTTKQITKSRLIEDRSIDHSFSRTIWRTG